MDRSIIRNAGLSLVLCAGLGMGAVAMTAQSAFAAENTDKAAATETTTTDDKAATTDTKADDKAATTDTKTDAKADDKAATTDTKATTLTDGTYTASSKGIGGDVPVTVTIKDGKISDVTVGDNSETQGIGSKAIEQLPAKIVEANGTDGVDAVSGASVTSKAIFTAVNDCLTQAGAGATTDSSSETMADGTYTASSKGIGGDVPVTVTVKDGKITKVEVGDNSETEGIGSKAIEQLPEKIVEANGTEGVDALSGASVTSKAIFTAVDDCMKQAKEAAAKTTDTKADDTKDADKDAKTDEKATDTKTDEKADTASTDKADTATTTDTASK